MSLDRGLDEEDMAHIYYGILPRNKKRWNAAICDNVDRHWKYYDKQN